MADLEQSVVAHLADILAPVSVSTRSRPSGAHVLVRRDGGKADRRRLRDTGRINIRFYADTPEAAHDLAAQGRVAVSQHVVSAGVVWVLVDEQSFARIHDDQRDQDGWMLIVDITARLSAGAAL